MWDGPMEMHCSYAYSIVLRMEVAAYVERLFQIIFWKFSRSSITGFII